MHHRRAISIKHGNESSILYAKAISTREHGRSSPRAERLVPTSRARDPHALAIRPARVRSRPQHTDTLYSVLLSTCVGMRRVPYDSRYNRREKACRSRANAGSERAPSERPTPRAASPRAAALHAFPHRIFLPACPHSLCAASSSSSPSRHDDSAMPYKLRTSAGSEHAFAKVHSVPAS